MPPLPSVPSKWIVVYASGVAYRSSPSFNDRDSSGAVGPECGTRFKAVRAAYGADQVLYLEVHIVGSGLWIPVTSPGGKIQICREVGGATEGTPWRAAKDPQTGRTYYFNSKTKETVWNRPADFISPPQQKASNVPPAMISLSFQVPLTWRPGQYVTVDLPGGGSQLVGMAPDVKPGQTVKVKIPNPALKPGGAAPPPPTPANTTGEWKASKDPKTGRIFYVNMSTKETTWSKPPGFKPAPPPPPGKSSGVEVTFTVPATWQPGQTINVRKPDGTMAQVAVAAGVKPGQTVRVCV